MRYTALVLPLVRLLPIAVLVIGSCYVHADETCSNNRKELTFKRQQLLDHMDAMKKLYDQNELTIMAILNHKIRDLIEDVTRLEDAVRDCSDTGAPPPRPGLGLGAVKSEVAEYATKNCEELRTLLLQLVQKTTAARRRDGSLFSPLTSAEKTELQDAEQAFRDVKAAIKNRCSREEPPPVRGRRRP